MSNIDNRTNALGLNPLDLGSNVQLAPTWLGPSLGWQNLPVAAQTYVTTSTYTVTAFDARVLLVVPVTAVQLPDVTSWMLAQGGLNYAGMDRSLWIKDLAYAASVGSPVVITPAGSDTIDGLSSYQIVTPGDFVALYPILNTVAGIVGWYSG